VAAAAPQADQILVIDIGQVVAAGRIESCFTRIVGAPTVC